MIEYQYGILWAVERMVYTLDRKFHYKLELTPEQMIHLVNTFETGYDYFRKAWEVSHVRQDATRMKIADDIMENLDLIMDQLEDVMNKPEEFKGVL